MKKTKKMKKVKKVKQKGMNLLLALVLTILFFALFVFDIVMNYQETLRSSVSEDSNEMEEMSIEPPIYQTIPSGVYFDNISKRATMDVNFNDGVYYFVINWGSSASENTKWEFSGKYDRKTGLIAYKDAVCTNELYDSDGNADREIIFENGKGVVKYDNKKLYWDDSITEKNLGSHYNGIFEEPYEPEVDAFNNTYNITNNYYGQPIYPGIGGYGSAYNTPRFSILNYDRSATNYSNGAPMITRFPIIGCNYPELANAANAIIPNAYRSIETWIRNNISFTKYQDYYLNYAKIVGQSPTTLVLMVNCSLKRKGVLSEHMTFRVNLSLDSNWFDWTRVTDTYTRRVY